MGNRSKIMKMTFGAMIAAAYLVLTLPLASFSFGIVQFRLAEALTVLPVIAAFADAAVPGLFLGCLISNLLNPNNLGLIDIVMGSLATLIAAYLSRVLAKRARRNGTKGKISLKQHLLPLLPPVLVNALIVGTYLPFILESGPVHFALWAGSVGAIALSQTLVIYGLGLPFLLSLERLPLAQSDFAAGAQKPEQKD